jgi:hypothetical protein
MPPDGEEEEEESPPRARKEEGKGRIHRGIHSPPEGGALLCLYTQSRAASPIPVVSRLLAERTWGICTWSSGTREHAPPMVALGIWVGPLGQREALLARRQGGQAQRSGLLRGSGTDPAERNSVGGRKGGAGKGYQ